MPINQQTAEGETMAQSNWTRNETLMAFTLYRLLPVSHLTVRNEDICSLAKAIGRTPAAVKLKAWNIAAYDSNRIAVGKKGMEHGSHMDRAIWEEFEAKGDSLLDEGLDLLAKSLTNLPRSRTVHYAIEELPPIGAERKALRTERVNQQYFRNRLMENYGGKCCVTGIAIPELLIASHIKPWAQSDPKTERLAADNGLLLNALHDRAFDQGLITVTKDYRIVLSSKVSRDGAASCMLLKSEGQRIAVPSIKPPAKEFLEYHNDVIFVA